MWPVRFIGQPVLLQLAFRLAAGGDEQNRTVDPLLARQVLSQLSYAPVAFCVPGNGGLKRTRTSDLTLIRRAL